MTAPTSSAPPGRGTPPTPGTTIRTTEPPTARVKARVIALGGRIDPTTTGWKITLPAGTPADAIAGLL